MRVGTHDLERKMLAKFSIFLIVLLDNVSCPMISGEDILLTPILFLFFIAGQEKIGSRFLGDAPENDKGVNLFSYE